MAEEPKTPPPPSTPPRPWKAATPAPPSAPPVVGDVVEVKLSKRLLWVDGAAYPLQNIARVYTFTLHPRRAEAFVRFMKRMAVLVLVGLFLAFLTEENAFGSSSYESDSDPVTPFLWFIVVCLVIYFVGDMLSVVLAKSHFVLAVETSGPSQAVVTSRDRAYLRQLVHTLAEAIENPENEFAVKVERVMISNPANYFFGNAVNMYGGNGNVGMSNG
ncbi:DUF6232 family protein [Streptomyces sp. NPDC056527]|uniref:DUF6232 family protein n=1 Tax=Streptomyces sp. NPDC056527 TaxID=3345853 RepID=UPI003698B223